MIKETKRSPHDALCVCQGIWSTNNSVVYGGGSAEISCSIAHAADRHPGVEQVCVDFGASLWIRMHFVFHSISGTEYRCLGTLHSCEVHLQILFVFYRSMDLYWQAIYIFFIAWVSGHMHCWFTYIRFWSWWIGIHCSTASVWQVRRYLTCPMLPPVCRLLSCLKLYLLM